MGATERAFIATPVPTAGAKVIASPFQFWTTGEDNLLIYSLCSVSGVSLTLTGRFLSPDGTISAASWTHTPNGNRTFVVDTYPLGVGAALNLVVRVLSGVPAAGQCFVNLSLIRGSGSAAIILGVLLQGYVTPTQLLAWPGSPLATLVDVDPPVRTIVGTQPGVGLGISETVPTNARWELLTFRHTITGNPNLVSNTLSLTIRSAGQTVFTVPAQQPWTGGIPSAEMAWLPGFSSPVTAASSVIVTPLPVNLRLPAGASINTSAFGSYQQSAPTYLVREWLDA